MSIQVELTTLPLVPPLGICILTGNGHGVEVLLEDSDLLCHVVCGASPPVLRIPVKWHCSGVTLAHVGWSWRSCYARTTFFAKVVRALCMEERGKGIVVGSQICCLEEELRFLSEDREIVSWSRFTCTTSCFSMLWFSLMIRCLTNGEK